METKGADFVTGYAQQAEKKTQQLFESAIGKVLFIDEAYSLKQNVDAINTIVALLTDQKFKGKMAVVFAGYEKDIEELLCLNAGLKSRIAHTVRFPHFSLEMCVKLFKQV